MSNKRLRQRFTLTLFFFTFSVLIVLFAYYYIFSSYVRQNTREAMAVTEDRLLSELNEEYSRLKVAANVIAGSIYVQEFLVETDVTAYYEKAGIVSEIISRSIYPHMSGDHILTISQSGVSYLFTGGISSGDVGEIYGQIDNSGTTQYLIAELDGVNYFCLISPVFSRGRTSPDPVGYVVALSHLAKARRFLTDPVALMGIDKAIIAGDVVLISGNHDLEGVNVAELNRLYGSVTIERVADSNLHAAVMITDSALFFGERLLAITSVIILAALIVTFVLLHRVLSTRMVSPMLQRADAMRMGLLKTQIDAHFIVNTITCIVGLARQGKNEKIVIAAENLSKMLTSRHDSDNEVNVYEQMEDIDRYIEIMNIRSEDKFDVTMDVDEALLRYRMPGRILQPIVENALTHGLGNKTEDCRLSITGRLETDHILFEVADNGIGIEKKSLRALQEVLDTADEWDYDDYRLKGVALINTQKRIRSLCGGKYGGIYGLILRGNAEGGLTVIIKLPANREQTEAD